MRVVHTEYYYSHLIVKLRQDVLKNTAGKNGLNAKSQEHFTVLKHLKLLDEWRTL